MGVPQMRAPSASEVPHRLAGVPVLVGIQLLTDLQTQILPPLQHLAYLYRLRHPVQVLVFDPPVQRLGGLLGEPGHAPQPFRNRTGILQDAFALGVHASSLGLAAGIATILSSVRTARRAFITLHRYSVPEHVVVPRWC